MQTENSNMNLFKNKNNFDDLIKNIDDFAKTNGYGLLSKEKNWILFDKDEIKVQIKFIEMKGKEHIEFRAPLLFGVSQSTEMIIAPICREKYIRDIAKNDLIGRCSNKIELIRYIKNNEKIYRNKTIEKNIKSMLKKAKKLQEEIFSLFDYTIFIKLN